MLVVDGNNMVFGRLASQLAKKLIEGEEVHLINAEKLVIRGSPKQIEGRYLIKRGLRNKGTPERSPTWSKLPHFFVKRMMRGMLPDKNSRGKAALARLRVYTGNPKELKANIKFENAVFDRTTRYVTIHAICKAIGYSG